ncbi:von Willebrand factor A domain-containing protein 7-like [Panulirus ornatus]|uniref:von Willebrand factor A domain-containing protein 7-like n=1 Tax=Panulirus ornatus TaxID=150431 RepID=UPI003A8760FC
MTQRWFILSLLVVVLRGTDAFLATPLNTSDPDVAGILCPEQTVGVTRDHKWITREAIRVNIRRFFLDNPPPSQPNFNVPTTASLTQLYHAYYGAASSPARFIKAVNSIAAANVKADSATQVRHDPDIQGDAEALASLQTTLIARYPQIQTAILVDEAYPAARSLLGLSLHSIQKFYAHSTWVEQDHTNILADLGLPGFVFDDLAEPAEDVCTPCSNPQGGCAGNVLSGAGLSSGYYMYNDPAASAFLVDKPTSGGKCSHGGVLDESASSPAQGGINKDTASPCFSPHYHLHEQAAKLAVQATDHYLSVLLDVVGNEKYRRLFDLYHGSALSISIDTTGSMTDDIDAVKEQVKLIVENTNPELYVLAPFHDPTWGPGLKTDNASEFLEAVMALDASGGYGPLEEMFWSGLQLALSLTPDYGDIFTFTDAGGRDGEKMESDIARAKMQHCKVSVIYSGRIPTATTQDPRQLLTGVDDYRRLTDSTGGLFIPSDKFDISAITPILGEGVESASVDITQLQGLQGAQDIQIPIDDSIQDFEIRIAGSITSGLLRDITGTEYDLMNQVALEADPAIEIVAYSSGLKAIRWLEPRYGQWNLQTDSSSTYSISVNANSTLNFLGGFSILDPSPPHPHYRSSEGSPLINTVYYVDVTLIGYLESDVTDVTRVEYVDKTGMRLREIPYHGEVDDEFYIRSDPLPEQPFYLKLYGHVQSGNVFCRLLPVLITPVDTSVGVLATTEDLAARPGEESDADFIVTNYGLSSFFTITGTDDKGFMQSVIPSTIYIQNNSSVVVQAHFVVPNTATPGTVSMVTVTAQSDTQTQSVNSAISQFVVLPLVSDVAPPTCILNSQPDCSGYDLNGICSEKNWTAQASLQDELSGLVSVYGRPAGFSTELTGFTPGTTDQVGMLYSASCCNSQVDLIGVDSVGNMGKCRIDMGTLGGLIYDLEAVSVGETWVELRWSMTPTQYDIHKYTLLINDDSSEDSRCQEEVCHHNVTYLRPCSLQTFQLTPHFYVGGEDRVGQAASTQATTKDQVPGAPANGQVVSVTETSAVVSWDAVNTKCISLFRVCYRPYGIGATTLCEQTATNTYNMRGLEACAVYEVTVTSLAPSGLPSSDSLVFMVNTDEAAPGAPRNVEVALSTLDTVTITWDDPLDRAFCVDKYQVSYSEKVDTAKQTKEVGRVEVEPSSDNIVTISDLIPCTNYTFQVAAVSRSGYKGPYSERDAGTLEGEPSPVDSLALDMITTVSLHVSWDASMQCVDHFLLCYYNDEEVGEVCNTLKDTEETLTKLLSCTAYHVSVTPVTPSGAHGNTTWQSDSTLEAAPGEPQNLTVVQETPHSIEVNFDPPVVNPQCAVEYDYQITDQGTAKVHEATIHSPRLDNNMNNLEACTAYEIRVRAVSPGGLRSKWVTTRAATSEQVTSEPRKLELRQKSETMLDLTWWSPDENDKCAQSYHLEWTGPGGVTDSKNILPPAEGELPFEVEAQVTDLSPCTEYAITVAAVTPLGTLGPVISLSASTDC